MTRPVVTTAAALGIHILIRNSCRYCCSYLPDLFSMVTDLFSHSVVVINASAAVRPISSWYQKEYKKEPHLVKPLKWKIEFLLINIVAGDYFIFQTFLRIIRGI